jgi:peptidoglycan/LPS O-acetylase OafA/YrhL
VSRFDKTALPAEHSAPRYHALDGLRGVAALFVVLYHIGWVNHITPYRFFRNGYLAVDLFFILSGLVIASNYAERIRSSADVIHFLRLRFFRLYPLHAVVLAAFVVLEVVKLIALRGFHVAPGIDAPFTGQNSLGALVANVLLIQAWHLFPSYSYNGPSWSISCEVAAYLLFAAWAGTGALRRRSFYVAGLILTGICYLWLADIFHAPAAAMQWGVPRALAGFFLGVFIWRYIPSQTISLTARARSVAQVILLVVIVSILGSRLGAAAVWVIPFFAALIAMLQSDDGIVARVLLTNPIQLLGRWSYSIYMIHSLVLVSLDIAFKRVFKWSLAVPEAPAAGTEINVWVGDALLLGVLAAILVLALVGFKFVEEPGRLYGRRTSKLGAGRAR